MKKIILAMSLAAMMLLCGCGADTGSVTITSVPQVSSTPEETQEPIVIMTPAATPGPSFTIPRETKVFDTPEELAAVKPLFEDYLTGNEIFMFAVSAVFNGDAYLMGFLYEGNEETLQFSRVTGLKQNGTGVEEALISDNYKPDPEGRAPMNFVVSLENHTFYSIQAFETEGMLVVKTIYQRKQDT